tara:strand:+ start:218 stop:499 length:282 start_codon:yes stop_codon:yes gene_type:complete
MDSVKQLIAHLQSCGTIRKPKKEGGLGLLVFNPRNLDIALVERLCDEAGLMVRNNATPTMFDNKIVEPHIWVGPPSAGVTTDEAVDALISQLS